MENMENIDRVCEGCGRPYRAVRNKQRFCCPLCRYRYWTRHRHEVKAIENEGQLFDSCQELQDRCHAAVGEIERLIVTIDRLQEEALGLVAVRQRLEKEQLDIEEEIKRLVLKASTIERVRDTVDVYCDAFHRAMKLRDIVPTKEVAQAFRHKFGGLNREDRRKAMSKLKRDPLFLQALIEVRIETETI